MNAQNIILIGAILVFMIMLIKDKENKLTDRLVKLLELKSIISTMLVSAATYGFVKGLVSVEVFIALVVSVITYYFTRKESGDTK